MKRGRGRREMAEREAERQMGEGSGEEGVEGEEEKNYQWRGVVETTLVTTMNMGYLNFEKEVEKRQQQAEAG